MTRAHVACLAVALACACGDDTAEISAYSRRQAEIDRAMAEAEAAAARARAEMIAADGKHWYDLPKVGQLQPGLHECERYVAAMRSFGACNKVPTGTGDGLRQHIDAMMASWRSVMTPTPSPRRTRAAGSASRR